MDKGRSKNAKQFSWFLLLPARCATMCANLLVASLRTVFSAIKSQIVFRASSRGDKPGKEKILFRFIGGFLALSFVLLALEIVACWNGWHLLETTEVQGWMHSAYLSWIFLRANYIAYPVQAMSNLCKFLFIVQSTDRVLLCLGWFWIKFRDIKPRLKVDSFRDDEGLEYEYPMVLVQIPMCNEKEVRNSTLKTVSFDCSGLFQFFFYL